MAELRLQNAFLLAAVGKVNDPDAAWKLANLVDVQVDDSGNITGLDKVIATTVERYPYLAPAEDEPAPFQPLLPVEPSGGPANGARKSDAASTRAALVKKFPALGRMPRR